MSNNPNYYSPDIEIADLGAERFDQDVAAIGDRDHAFFATGSVNVAKGRAPKGLESQVFAWNQFAFVDEDKDVVAEMKGDLHGGQLHRANRAARESAMDIIREEGPMGGGYGGGGMGPMGGGRGEQGFGVAGFGGLGGKSRGKKKDGGIGGGFQAPKPLRAACKPPHDARPLAKGFAEELSADMFWNTPIAQE
ncbi:hypothetical protein CC78DRAFT_583834 [Lojkania enalia]|uniref:Uncharacterized protein n=1 Tax=Lojkania enalia TaxID=147567 RepID=A0A9P4K878_9PLEO|nr:hypothetical protein CC78DRAFT_583834 [Didymosphaeria enalia]